MNRNWFTSKIILFLLTILLFSMTTTFAGNLEGYITDSTTGDPIVNASLTLYLPGTGTEVMRTVTDSEGYYFLNPAPQLYDLTARSYGYMNSTVEDVLVEESTTTVNFSMITGVEPCMLVVHVWGDMENTIPLENVAVSITELDIQVITGPDGTADAGEVSSDAYTIILTHIPTGSQGYHDITLENTEVTDRTVPLNLCMPEILPPENLGGINGDGFITLTWNPPADQFTQEEMQAIPGQLENLREFYNEVLENDSESDLAKLPEVRKKIFQIEQALQRFGDGSNLDELSNFAGYYIRVNGEIWNDQPVQETFVTIPAQNGIEYTCDVAADYGYDPEYRVWSNSVLLLPMHGNEYVFEEVDYEWTELNPDLGGIGEILINEGDDENSGFVDMGITFNFYGTNYSQIAVCTNGWMSFTDDASIGGIDLTIPSVSLPNGILVPLNIDLDLETYFDDFVIWKYTDAADQLFIVQYNAKYYSDPNETYSFQVVLNGNDNSVIYRYESASQGWTTRNPVIGFEDQEGAQGGTYFNGYLTDNYAVSFTPTQNSFGGILGTITDSLTELPIENAEVSAEGVNGLVTFVESDNAGYYQLPLLNRLFAPYTLTYEYEGYEILVINDVDWPDESDYFFELDTTLVQMGSDSPPTIVSVDGEYDDRFVVILTSPGIHLENETSRSSSNSKELNTLETIPQATSTSLDEIGDVLWYMLQYSTELTPWETYDIEGDTLFAPDGEFCEIPVILGSENENTYYYFQVSAWMTDPEGLVDSLQTEWVWQMAVYNMPPASPPDFTVDAGVPEIAITVTPPTTNVDGSELVDIALYKAWMEVEGDYVEVASSETPELIFSVDETGLCNFRVTVEDEVPNVSEYSDSIDVLVYEVLYETGFEEGEWDFFLAEDVWENGIPTAGPGTAYEGSNVWATYLEGDYNQGEQEKLSLLEPLRVLTENARIIYRHWYEYDETGRDGYNLTVSTNNGIRWQVVEPTCTYPFDNIEGLYYGEDEGFSGTTGGDWQEVTYLLNDYIGEDILISINHGSNYDNDTGYGVAIDDLKLCDLETPPFGAISGILKVCDTNGEPISGAEIWATDVSTMIDTTDAEGAFEIFLPTGTHELIFEHEEYWHRLVENIEVNEGETTDLHEIYMTYPEGLASPDTIDIVYDLDSGLIIEDGYFTLENFGCGPMEYEITSSVIDWSPSSNLPNVHEVDTSKENFTLRPFDESRRGPVLETSLDDLWDLLYSFENIDTYTGHSANYGIGVANELFYISNYYTGRLTGFDYMGTPVCYTQISESMAGDEYPGLFGLGNSPDGHLYGGNDRGDIFEFLPGMTDISNIGNISNPVISCAYDCNTGKLYIADDEGGFYSLNLESGEITQLSSPSIPIYGLAYYPADPDGLQIYGHVATNPTSIIRSDGYEWDETPFATIYQLEEGEEGGDIASGVLDEQGYLYFLSLKQGENYDTVDLREGYWGDYTAWYTIYDFNHGILRPGESTQIYIDICPNCPEYLDYEPGEMCYILIGITGPHLEDMLVVARVFWTSDVDEKTQLPTEYALHQNYPNPFNPSTSIKFDLVEAQPVKLTIYNMLGQEVARLLDTQVEAGYHNVNFDASHLASGIYFYRLETPVYTKMKKMVMIK